VDVLEVLVLVRREEVEVRELLLVRRLEVRDEDEDLEVLLDEDLEEGEDGVGVRLVDDVTLGKGMGRLNVEDALLLSDEAEREGVLVKMLKLGSEDVDDALVEGTVRLSLEETRLLADEDDAEIELGVGRDGVGVEGTLLLDGNESLVLESKNEVAEVALEVELENGGVGAFEDGIGGLKYPLVVEFTCTLEIVVGWISEDEFVGMIGVGVEKVELVVAVTAGVDGTGAVPVPHVE
jgi:hypothetical protein